MDWDSVMELHERVLPNVPLDGDPRIFIRMVAKTPLFLPGTPEGMDVDDGVLEGGGEASEVDELEGEESGAIEESTGEVASLCGQVRTK
jgi:hypothetical protein